MVTVNATFSLAMRAVAILDEMKDKLKLTKSKILSAIIFLLKKRYDRILDENEDMSPEDVRIELNKYLRSQLS